MSKRKLVCLLSVSLVLLSPLTALAEEPAKSASSSDSDYAYKFEDDALLGSNTAASGDIMRVRKGAARVMLLRPRLHFVAEMLKSTENL